MIRKKKNLLLLLQLRQFLSNPKNIVILSAAAVANATYIIRYRDVLGNGERLSFIAPFLMILSSPQVFPSPHFFISAFVFFLLAQNPDTNSGLYYHLIRTSRRRWLINEILQVVSICLSSLIFLFIASFIVMIPHISLNLSWDSSLQVWQDALIGAWKASIPYSVVYQLSQTQALAYAVGFWLLYCVSGGLLMLVLRLAVPVQRNIGLGIVFCLYFYDYICEYFLPYALRYASPVALSKISYLNLGFDAVYPSPGYALAFFSIYIFLLIIAVMRVGRQVNLDLLSSRTNT